MSERDVLLEDVFQGALAVHACFMADIQPIACRAQLIEAVDAMVAYENGNPAPIRAQLAAQEAVIKAARDIRDNAVSLGVDYVLSPEQFRAVCRALAAVDGGGRE